MAIDCWKRPTTRNFFDDDFFKFKYGEFPNWDSFYSKNKLNDIGEKKMYDNVGYGVYATENGSTIVLNVAGVEKDDISVMYEDDGLSISIERKPLYEEKEIISKYESNFVKSGKNDVKFPIDTNAYDVSKITSSHENGLLYITVPYSAKSKPRKIKIL